MGWDSPRDCLFLLSPLPAASAGSGPRLLARCRAGTFLGEAGGPLRAAQLGHGLPEDAALPPGSEPPILLLPPRSVSGAGSRKRGRTRE